MNKFYAFAPTYFGIVLIFFFGRDYYNLPLKKIAVKDIAYKLCTVKQSFEEVTLPSGYAGDMSIIVNETNAAFRLAGINKSRFINSVQTGDTVEVGYASQQEDLVNTNTTLEAFSLKAKGESFLMPDEMTASHNKMIAGKQRVLLFMGIGTIAVLLLTIWLMRRNK
jgi:hypothetical protein